MLVHMSFGVYEVASWFVEELNSTNMRAKDYADACHMMVCVCKHPKDVAFKELFCLLQRLCELSEPDKILQITLREAKQ